MFENIDLSAIMEEKTRELVKGLLNFIEKLSSSLRLSFMKSNFTGLSITWTGEAGRLFPGTARHRRRDAASISEAILWTTVRDDRAGVRQVQVSGRCEQVKGLFP